jgi:carboxymethylenebutenolidase
MHMNDMPKITQSMIDLYDEFTHVSLNRDDYLSKLANLVGSSELARSITAQIESNKQANAIVDENDARIETEMVTLPNGLVGYLAKPKGAAGKLPAVIIIHENRGLVPHIKDVVRRAAVEGFLAFGPDYLAPLGGTPEDEDVGRDMIAKLERPAVIQDSLKAVEFVRTHANSNGNVGLVGFCWGGGIANATAVAAGDAVKAAVAYYGAQPKADDVAKIKAFMLLHYAGQDERINAGIDAFRAALQENKIAHEIHVYEGAQHAFNNETAPARFHQEAANLAWTRTIARLKSALA